ncbi:FCD domain-containing protein [Cytobacillus sp. FSL R5-0569]|uniref:GntR family transcriptional regulator n=1 Tax=Cytobacillus sp. FSL R5-0569 TaxID=2921649 RepID=UPI0030FD0596
MRLTLEKMALEWSYKHIDSVALARLSEIVLEMERKLTSPAEWNELNRQFHTLIYTYAQSKPMLEMLSIVWGRVEPYMNIYSTKLDYLIFSQKEHEQLLEALIKKDIATLHHVLTLHIRQTKEAILEKLEK